MSLPMGWLGNVEGGASGTLRRRLAEDWAMSDTNFGGKMKIVLYL